MGAKALWLKEYRQARGLLWAIFASVTVLLTVRVLQALNKWERFTAAGRSEPVPFLPNLYAGLPFLLPALVIALACLQIGAERSHGGDHFTFSLPFSRPHIFLVKWVLGVATITVSLVLNGSLTSWRIAASPLAADLNLSPPLWPYLLQLLAASLATYTLALFLGALVGNALFQAAFTVIFGIFPIGFLILVAFAIELHAGAFGLGPLHPPRWAALLAETGSKYLSVLTHFWPAVPIMGSPWEAGTLTWAASARLLAVDLVFSLLLLAWGAYLYSRNRLEYDGLMLVIPGARGFFLLGITTCFALLGGFIAVLSGGPRGEPSAGVLLTYYAGAVVLGALAYALSRPLLWRAACKPRQG